MKKKLTKFTCFAFREDFFFAFFTIFFFAAIQSPNFIYRLFLYKEIANGKSKNRSIWTIVHHGHNAPKRHSA